MCRILLFLVIICLINCTKPSNKDFFFLFNGENFDGWHVYGGGENFDGWSINNGELQFDFKNKKEAQPVNLITDSTYTNFELSLEWKISEQGNSGVFWGVVEDTIYEHPYQTGPEIQILDDDWDAYIKARGNKTRSGAIFGLLAPSKFKSKPAGEWNHYILHVDHRKNKGFIKFNDVKIANFPVNGDKWKAMITNSSFADWRGFGLAQTGHISLQDHGGQVAFRNIKIKKLF